MGKPRVGSRLRLRWLDSGTRFTDIFYCLGDRKLAALQPLTDPWEHCLNRIGGDIPQQQFNTWIRPLQAQWQGSGLVLSAPNRFIRDFVTEKYVPMIATYLLDIVAPASAQVSVTVVGGVVATSPQAVPPPTEVYAGGGVRGSSKNAANPAAFSTFSIN